MSLYQCEKCGCVENTAKGLYHSRHKPEWFIYKNESDKGKALCSACGPDKYANGEPTRFGKWHGRFTRRYYPLGSLYTDKEGNVRKIADNEPPSKEDEIGEPL